MDGIPVSSNKDPGYLLESVCVCVCVCGSALHSLPQNENRGANVSLAANANARFDQNQSGGPDALNTFPTRERHVRPTLTRESPFSGFDREPAGRGFLSRATPVSRLARGPCEARVSPGGLQKDRPRQRSAGRPGNEAPTGRPRV
jgi:hypothetical protein